MEDKEIARVEAERFSRFTQLMSGIGRCIRRIKTEEMAEFNLKSPHVSCLYYLYRFEPLTLSELCELCGEDKAALSRSADQLEKEGYIRHGEHRRYKAPLRLTDRGREVAERVARKIDGILLLSGEGMSEAERASFYRCLGRVNDNLQRICDKYE